MELGGIWRRVRRGRGPARTFPRPELRRRVVGRGRRCRATGDRHRRSAPTTARCSTGAGSRPARRTSAAAAWLIFDGVFYQSDVWLDGGYIGDTEGYFFPHTFEITDALRDRREHVLARRGRRAAARATARPSATSPACSSTGTASIPTGTRAASGVRCTSPRPARCASSGCACLCPEATSEQAIVAFRAVLDAPEAGTVVLRTTIGETDHEAEHRLAAGPNRVEWSVTIDQPQLWWPRALGDQPLHDVEVTVLMPAAEGAARPSRATGAGCAPGSARCGSIDWVDARQRRAPVPQGHQPGTDTHGAWRGDTGDAGGRRRTSRVDANLDLLRVHAHVTRPELYEAADEAGLLLWQDMPLHWGYARGIRGQATRQARELVDLLGHHPSIATVVRAQRADGDRRSWRRDGPAGQRRGRRDSSSCPHGTRPCSTPPSSER